MADGTRQIAKCRNYMRAVNSIEIGHNNKICRIQHRQHVYTPIVSIDAFKVFLTCEGYCFLSDQCCRCTKVQKKLDGSLFGYINLVHRKTELFKFKLN